MEWADDAERFIYIFNLIFTHDEFMNMLLYFTLFFNVLILAQINGVLVNTSVVVSKPQLPESPER